MVRPARTPATSRRRHLRPDGVAMAKRRGTSDHEVWRELLERAVRLNQTTIITVVARGRALVDELEKAPERLNLVPLRRGDRRRRLVFTTLTLHELAGYLESAYTVHEHIKTLIGKRKLLTNKDETVTAKLEGALRDHDQVSSNAAVYAMSNVFRHDIRPDTVNIETRATLDGGQTISWVVVFTLSMRGLTNGQGWTKLTKDFLGPSESVELIPLISGHLTSLSRLVDIVTGTIREEHEVIKKD